MITKNVMPESIYSFNSSKNNKKATESKSKNTDVFSDVMNLSLNKNSNTTQDSKSNKIESRKDSQDNYSVDELNVKKDSVIATNVTNSKKSENVYSNSVDNDNSLTSDKVKEIKGTLNQLQTKIQSTLDLSTEEFEQLLENLGFSMFDLLNPDNMKQFVLQANGSGDITSVLTDEKLANSMNQLLQMVNEINQNITLSKELMEELLTNESTALDNDNVEASNNSNVDTGDGINAKVIIVKDASLDSQSINSDALDNLAQNNTSQAVEAVNQDNRLLDSNLNSNQTKVLSEKVQLAAGSTIPTVEDNKSLNQNAQISTDSLDNTVSEDVPTTTYNMSDDNSLAQNNSSLSSQSKDASESNLISKEPFDLELKNETDSDLNTTLDGYLNNLVNLSQNTTINPETSIERISNFREIVNQIVEQIKIVINSEQTSMEMQLNPETLGKINLSLTSKDGVMTAHFTTQNEVTKEAIESQMQILKDNLNNQGLKVDSIEVTVSNFEFEQSNQAFTSDNQRNHSQGRGFIHFDEDLESKDSEDITLLNDLMEQMGSSVSYTA